MKFHGFFQDFSGFFQDFPRIFKSFLFFFFSQKSFFFFFFREKRIFFLEKKKKKKDLSRPVFFFCGNSRYLTIGNRNDGRCVPASLCFLTLCFSHTQTHTSAKKHTKLAER